MITTIKEYKENDLIKIAQEIFTFLDNYAKIRPDYDPEFDDIDDKYTGPDTYQLLAAANHFERNIIPDFKPWSEYGSGCYKYGDDIRIMHNDLITKINNIINNK